MLIVNLLIAVGGIAMAGYGALVFTEAKSAMHEIYAAVLLAGGVLILCAAIISDELRVTRKRMGAMIDALSKLRPLPPEPPPDPADVDALEEMG